MRVRGFVLIGCFLACGAQAFVASFLNSRNLPYTWNLTQPHPMVSTNVVNRTTGAVRFYLGSNAWSSANRKAELNALRASFDQWRLVPGTKLKFEDAGLIGPGVDVNVYPYGDGDGTNVVFWVRNTTFVANNRANVTGTLGLTFISYIGDEWEEADIVLNGRQNSWHTNFDDPTNPAYFVEAVALHEIGHLIGLDHSPVGGATMLARGSRGKSTQAGLSMDEIAGVRALYPDPAQASSFGTIKGLVRAGGAAVFGASVIAENADGNVVSGTLTFPNGTYELPKLPPGDYRIRVAPLDPSNAQYYLVRGRDIVDIRIDDRYDNVRTDFLPTENTTVTLSAGQTVNNFNFNVQPGEPAFRISHILTPSDTVVNNAIEVNPGDRDVWVGVYGEFLPTSNATLEITGDDITIKQTKFELNASFPPVSFNLISVRIDVDEDATPGMRSFILRQGSNLAYANGFIEVSDPAPDANFDGMNDRFQRRHFDLFTSAEAGPHLDPDGDRVSNYAESVADTDPHDAGSFLELESVRQRFNGTTITWKSRPGKKYRVHRRQNFETDVWKPIGGPVSSLGSVTAYLDTEATGGMHYYRVEALP